MGEQPPSKFDELEIDPRHTPMSLELRLCPLKWVKDHPEYLINRLYYANSTQYMGGSFYRAVLGYETIWDREYESQLVKSLDYHLSLLKKRKTYYFEELVFKRQTSIKGFQWERGVKPVISRLDLPALEEKNVAQYTTALARINRVDSPAHVDVDFSDGSTWTFSIARWQTAILTRSYGKAHNYVRPK